MSLFTFKDSATHTATTSEMINNAVIIDFLSLIFNSLSCLLFDRAKIRLFAHTSNIFEQKKVKNKSFVDVCQGYDRIFELRSKIGGISEISK